MRFTGILISVVVVVVVGGGQKIIKWAPDLYQVEECLNVTQLPGVIVSPRYPETYPRNLLLSWKLESPPGSRIRLEFDNKFRLEAPVRGVCR
uniref:CUB domain-containing protein n=1 Tax=Knipowitschia caucasica TaxID=637954 RepID=A0AAV2J1J7_KNICA